MIRFTDVARIRLPQLTPAEEPPPMEATALRISGQLVHLVQILFGVVVGQALLRYQDIIRSPFRHGHLGSAVALFSIFMMIAWSWIDWNTTMELRPYDLRATNRTRVEQTERLRLYSDLAIVVTYAYILFQVEPLTKNASADIRYLLIGYPIVFALYLASGLLRIARYGPSASRVGPILIFFLLFVVLVSAYVGMRSAPISSIGLNIGASLLSMMTTRAYRSYRRYSKPGHAQQATART